MWQLKDCTQRMQCVKCWAECKGVCAKYCATNVACTLNDEKCSVQCGPTKLHETSHASASHASAIYMHLMCVCVRVCLFFVVLLALQTSAISTWVYLSDVSSDASQRATCIFFILFSSKNDDFLSKSGPFFDAAGGSSEARALPATSWPPHLVPAWNGSFLIAADCQYHFIVWIGWIHALDLWHKGFHFFGKFRVNLWPENRSK